MRLHRETTGQPATNSRNRNVGVQATKTPDLYSDFESIIPKVEVAGSIPVSRSSFEYETECPGRQFCARCTADREFDSCLIHILPDSQPEILLQSATL
jgi:hypothetical protein